MYHINRVRRSVPEGTLIRGLDPAIYVFELGKKRPVADTETFHAYQLNAEGIVVLDESVLEDMETGTPVNIYGDFTVNSPATLLVKSSGSEIYLWMDGQLHPITSGKIYYRLRFHYSSVVPLPDELIALLPEGNPIQETTLLTHSLVNGRVYSAPNGLIYYGEQNKLRKIEGPSVFTFYRWRVEEIVHLTRDEFNHCRLGEPIL